MALAWILGLLLIVAGLFVGALAAFVVEGSRTGYFTAFLIPALLIAFGIGIIVAISKHDPRSGRRRPRWIPGESTQGEDAGM